MSGQLCHSLPHAGDGRAIAMFYIYLIGFDVLNAIGHCNFEFIPVVHAFAGDEV